ncbi:hypothetical protein RIEGSTA812A_PEG_1195 [invertebrate metagenome]|uniref:Uncharacterized protein n=1 Tax=invertebrate metagenome TaxID=1711999 RepID=A0A484HD21_9ZZZZ
MAGWLDPTAYPCSPESDRAQQYRIFSFFSRHPAVVLRWIMPQRATFPTSV